MKKSIFSSLFTVLALAMTMFLTGCGNIESGNVGLRTEWNGKINPQLDEEGFYTSWTSHVDKYSLREIGIDLENLTPKAKDNLSLKELDVTVFYKISKNSLRELALKRSGQSVVIEKGLKYAAYNFVANVARSEIADVVSKHDSLTIHTERDKIAEEVRKGMQDSLDASDPNAFTITRVIVRQITTDPTIEQNIRTVVAKEKELEAAKLQVAIAKANAEATQQTAQTLTPAFLQHEYNQALLKFAENKDATIVLDGSNGGKIINLK